MRIGAACGRSSSGGRAVPGDLAGGLCFAYRYVTDSETLAGLIEAEVPRYLPGSRLDLAPGEGEAVRRRVHLANVTAPADARRRAVPGGDGSPG